MYYTTTVWALQVFFSDFSGFFLFSLSKWPLSLILNVCYPDFTPIPGMPFPFASVTASLILPRARCKIPTFR